MPDTPLYSAFTPFFRRFTDEKARDVRGLALLYEEVGARHRMSGIERGRFGGKLYAGLLEPVPDPLDAVFRRTMATLLESEKTVFDFPEGIKLHQLSLKEQVDLQRFLFAKKHFQNNQEKVLDLLESGIGRILDGLTRAAPALSGPSPFTIPFIYTIDDPKGWIEGIIAVLGEARYQDNGVFTEIYTRLHLNLCEASGIAEQHNPKNKPWKLPTASQAPLAEILETYLKGTPFIALFNHPVPLKLTHEDRFSHMHVVGGSGAGKTQLLQHLILHDLQADDPPALVIVDSQTDLINKLSHLRLLTGPRGDDLIIISPRDIAHPPALNIFDVNRDRLGDYDEATREQVTAGVIQTFDYLFNGLLGTDLTAKQGVFFRFVARLMLALPGTMGRPATILDLLNLMEDAGPYQKAIQSLPPIQRNFFERDFQSKAFTQTKEQIRYRLNAILENPTLARLFTSKRTKIDLFSALNQPSIILVDTAKDFLKGASAHFGRIFISLVLQAILERAAIPEHERRPAFLIVDEAAAYFDSNIDDLLTEARKYKLGCIFAHQFLDQATSSLRASLAANTSIKMAAGISTADARALAPDMRTTPDFILNQPRLTFAAYIRGVTANAVSIPIIAGELERQPRISDEQYARTLEWNREIVSLPDEPEESSPEPLTYETNKDNGQPPGEDPGTGTSTDW